MGSIIGILLGLAFLMFLTSYAIWIGIFGIFVYCVEHYPLIATSIIVVTIWYYFKLRETNRALLDDILDKFKNILGIVGVIVFIVLFIWGRK